MVVCSVGLSLVKLALRLLLSLSSDSRNREDASRYRGAGWGLASVGRPMLPFKKSIFLEPQKRTSFRTSDSTLLLECYGDGK